MAEPAIHSMASQPALAFSPANNPNQTFTHTAASGTGTGSGTGTIYPRHNAGGASIDTASLESAGAAAAASSSSFSAAAHTSSVGASFWAQSNAWLVPVSWAIGFYCVLSLLVLCTLYGRGIIDGKLNFRRCPRRSRRRRRRRTREARRHVQEMATDPRSRGNPWLGGNMIVDEERGGGDGRHSARDQQQQRQHDDNDERAHDDNNNNDDDLPGHLGGRAARGGGGARGHGRRTRYSMSSRHESARIERALVIAGLL